MALGSVNLYNSFGTLIGNFTTVQAAVDAAANIAGSDKKIVVDGFSADETSNPPFSEQVTVDATTAPIQGSLTGLTIEGINGAVLQAPSTLVSTAVSPANSRNLDGVLTLIGTSGVTVEGFTVDGADEGAAVSGANDPTEVGIAVVNATGTVLTGDTVENVQDGATPDGAQQGWGIYVANAPDSTNTVTVENSTVKDFQKNGIAIVNADATVTGNTVEGTTTGNIAQNGIEMWGASGTVSNNTITGIGYTDATNGATAAGILSLNSVNLSIDDNTVTTSGPYTTGISAVNYGGTQSDVSVTNNKITGDGPTPAGLNGDNYSIGVDYDDGLNGGAVTGNSINGFDVGLEDDPAGAGTAAPTTSGNKFGADIGSAFFQGDGSFTPAPATVASSSMFASSGPGQIYVTDSNGDIVVDSVFSSIQAAIDAASSGDTVHVGNGTYVGNVALKDGVNVVGQSEAGVLIEGTLSTPVNFDDTTVSNLTVANAGVLLDMTGTSEITDSVFSNDAFNLTGDIGAAQAIGNGQVNGSIALSSDVNDTDGIGGSAGLTFSGVTMNADDYASGSTSFVYTLFHSVNGAALAINNVTLEGADDGLDGLSGLIGAQWNMSPNGGETADVTIENSNTSGGGNFYVSGMASATITGNTFDNQGVALNGVSDATVSGNTFENIDGSITANGAQARGLTIEDAWGAPSDSNISVTGNTFENISAADGAIALQRFTDAGGNLLPATISQLNNVTVAGNTFTGVVQPVYLNTSSFTSTSVIPDTFSGSQFIIGTSGADTFDNTSDTGDVTIFGGGGVDTAKFGAGYTLSFVNNKWQVSDGALTDTLVGVDKVVIGGTTYDLVDQTGAGVGGFQTIQSAIDDPTTQAGDIIEVAAGTYTSASPIDVDHSVTIDGANAGLAGTSSGRGAETVIEGGLEITAAGATLDGVTVDGSFNSVGLLGTDLPNGVVVTAADVTIENSVFTGDALDSRPFSSEGGATGFSFTNNLVSGWAEGAYIVEGGSGAISDNTFTADGNGVISESAGVAIDGNTFNSSSDIGAGPDVVVIGYDDEVVGDVVYGNSFTPGEAQPIGVHGLAGGKTITGSDTPSVFDDIYAQGAVTQTGGAGDDLFIGGPNGGALDGGGGVNTISYQFDSVGVNINLTAGTASGTDVAPTTLANFQNAIGGSGNDTFTGDGASSVLTGGGGVDTVDYAGATHANLSVVNGDWTLSGGSGGTDTLIGVDEVDGGQGHKILLVGHGAFATIQAAIDAANTGDIIYVGPGTYDENLDIDKGVTIEGANSGVNGASTRGAETIITGQAQINTTDQVVIDGVEFLDAQPLVLSSSSQFTSLTINENSTAGDIVENSVFENAPTNDTVGTYVSLSKQPTTRGIDIGSVGAGQSVSIEDNLFTGPNTNSYAGDDWRSAIYSNGGAGATDIAGNTFDNSRTAINADNFSSTVTVNNNMFDDDGTGLAIGVGSSVATITSITNNTFSDVGEAFNLKNVTTPTTFDVGGAGNTDTSPGAPLYLEVGGGGTLTGTSGSDVLQSDGGAVTFVHTAGGDTLAGAAGVINTAEGYDSSAKLAYTSKGWTVTDDGSTDLLFGVDKVMIGTTTYDLVDQLGAGVGGFQTIQSAVSNASAGDTILIAGGTYDEQVTVTTDGLTIEGLSGAVLQAPATTLQSTGQSPDIGGDIGNLDSVLALAGTTNVTVENLTIDGATQGANLAAGQTNASEVGVSAINSTGTVLDDLLIENVRESDAGFGDQRGLAVYAANSLTDDDFTFTIENSTVENFQKNGITVLNADATVTGNTVTGTVTGSQAQNGIEIGGSSGLVSNNTISDIGYTRNDGAYNASGVIEFDGSNLSIDSNKISIGGVYTTGIFAYNDQTTQNNVSVTNNTITGAGPTGLGLSAANYSDGVYYEDGTGGGAVTGNTISGFDVGVEDGSAGVGTAAPTLTGNDFTSGIGAAYFLRDGATTPTPTAFIAANNFPTSGPGEIYVTGAGAPDAVYSSIQAAIDAASSGDTVHVGNGTYVGNVALKDGVNVVGQSEAGVLIEGTLSTPVNFDDTTVSNLTVANAGVLLDMTGTSEITDSVFSNDAFNLTGDIGAAQAIGNGQVNGSIALSSDANDTDGIGGSAGLTFSGVTMNADDYASGSTSFVYTLFHSVNGAALAINNVTLEGADDGLDGLSGLIGAQWNMSPNGGETADVTIENSNTSGGGNFYVSGMASATITGNTFDNQGVALNGVSDATVSGNTFENIDGSITANGSQARGLTIEDAWGAPSDSNISVTGNTFENISAADGAIALQRFTDAGGNLLPATISQLNNVTVAGNTFTGVDQPVYLNTSSFTSTSVIPDTFSGSQFIIGTSGADTFDNTSDTGDVTIFGGGGVDTAKFGAGYTLSFVNNKWQVSDGALTDTLVGVDKVVIGGTTYDLVDQTGAGVGGFQTIQAAVNGASAGDTILVAGGTYDENVTLNKNSLTLENVSGETVTIDGLDGYTGAVSVAQGITGATIESSDSASHFVLQAASGETAALYLVGGDTDVTVSGITASGALPGSGGSNAVLTGGGLDNVTFEGDVFSGSAQQLVYVNGVADGLQADTSVNFTGDTFSGTAGLLLGNDANSGSVTGDSFSGTADYGVGLGAPGLTVSGNSFGSGVSDVYFAGDGSYDPAAIVLGDTFPASGAFYLTGSPDEDAVYASVAAALAQGNPSDTIVANTATVTLTTALATQLEAAGEDVSAPSVVLQDTAAHIQALTAAQIAGLPFVGVTSVTATDASITMTAAKAVAFENAGLKVSVPTNSSVTISDTTAHISALTLSQIAGLGGVGVMTVTYTDAPATLTLTAARAAAFANAGVSLVVGNGDKIVVSDTAADIAAAFDGLNAAAWVSKIIVTDSATNKVTITAAQAANDNAALGKLYLANGSTLAHATASDAAANIATYVGSFNADIDTVVVNGGAGTLQSAVSAGTLQVTGSANLTIGANLSYAGAFSEASGSTITVASPDTLTLTGTSSLAGKVTGAGALAIAGGTTTFASGVSLSVASLSVTGGTTTAQISTAVTDAKAFSAGSGATLALTGGTLILSGSTSFTGAKTSGADRLYTEGPTTISGLTLGGTGGLGNLATVTENGGNLTIGDNLGNAAALVNGAKATWDITDNSGIGIGTSTASFINSAGLFEKTGGTLTSTISASFTDSGIVTVTTGTLAFAGATNLFAGAINGAGKIGFSGGATTLATGTSIAAATSVAETGAGTSVTVTENLGVAGPLTQGAGSTLSLNGSDTLTLSGTASLAGSVTGAGTLAINGGTTTIASGASLSESFWSISGAATSAIMGAAVAYGGTFSAGSGATLALTGGTLALTGATSFSGATTSGADRLYTQGVTTVSGLTLGGTGGLSNINVVTQRGGDLTIGDSLGDVTQLLNSAKGTWNIADDSDILRGSATGSSISNVGAISKTGGTGTSMIATSIVNTGTIGATSGTLDLQGAISGAGGLTVASGATLEVDGVVGSSQTLTYKSGSTGEFSLADLLGGSFHGAIGGWAAGDTLDLGAPFGSGTTAVFTENANNTSGTLALTDGTNHTSISFLGKYSTSNFTLGADSGAGTLLTYHS